MPYTHYPQQYSYYCDHPEAVPPRRPVVHPQSPQSGHAWPQTGPQRPSRYAQHSQPAPRRKLRPQRRPKVLWAGAGGGMVAFAALVVTPQFAAQEAGSTTVCEQRVETQSVLSRDELSELLAIPERASRDEVQAVIAEPFCVLSQAEFRGEVAAEREAYPLAFDPQTWLIVLYEEGEYAGYDFSFTRE